MCYNKYNYVTVKTISKERKTPRYWGEVRNMKNMTAEERINRRKQAAERKLFELRRDMAEVGAKELTPPEGIELRQNLDEKYRLEDERYVSYCYERRVYMWDLYPEKKQ